MRLSKNFTNLGVITLATLFFCFQTALGQTFNLDKENSFLQINGTSSLHDWHSDAEEKTGSLKLSDVNAAKIETLHFSVKSESIKSGKTSMDKNTYKALKTKDYKTIDFHFKNINSINKVGADNYKLSVNGNLVICGVTKQVILDFDLTIMNDVIKINGEKSILMTDYGIEPPKALLGTIKTGNEITLIFKPIFKKTIN